MVPRGADAELFVVGARLDGANVLVLVESGADGLTVEADPAMGVRAASLTTLTLDGVRVPDERRARRDRRHDVRRVRAAVAARLVRAGRGRRAGGARLRDAVRQGARGVRRADRPPPVGGVHGRRHRDRAAGDAAAHLEGRVARGGRARTSPARSPWPARCAPTRGCRSASTASSCSGGHGFVKEHPVERWYRDLRAVSIMEGGVLV